MSRRENHTDCLSDLSAASGTAPDRVLHPRGHPSHERHGAPAASSRSTVPGPFGK
jgi:hypothetical protein